MPTETHEQRTQLAYDVWQQSIVDNGRHDPFTHWAFSEYFGLQVAGAVTGLMSSLIRQRTERN